MVWMPAAIECVKAAAICRVPPAREFELLPLWFFVVDIVASDGWLADYSASTESLQAFSKAIQSACGLIATTSLWETFGREATCAHPWTRPHWPPRPTTSRSSHCVPRGQTTCFPHHGLVALGYLKTTHHILSYLAGPRSSRQGCNLRGGRSCYTSTTP